MSWRPCERPAARAVGHASCRPCELSTAQALGHAAVSHSYATTSGSSCQICRSAHPEAAPEVALACADVAAARPHTPQPTLHGTQGGEADTGKEEDTGTLETVIRISSDGGGSGAAAGNNSGAQVCVKTRACHRRVNAQRRCLVSTPLLTCPFRMSPPLWQARGEVEIH
eukprot:352952-Chlamydomonas_euryale.AAC.10